MKDTVKSMSLHAFIRLVALSALLVVTPKAAFAETASQPWPISIRNQIDRIGNVEYRLRKSAANLCSDSDTLTGIKVDYIGAYATGDQQVVREYAGLGDAPQVISVAAGSPAESAGIQVGDDILSVNGALISQLHTQSDDTALLADQIEERLAATPEGRDVTLVLERGGQPVTVSFKGETACATRFILKTGKGLTAYSDGNNVALSGKLVDFARNADELAIFAGHELAHVVARDGKASGLGQRRAMEDRADILGADLMRCAGFDVNRGLAIWQRYNKRDWLRWLRGPSHRNVPERIRRIEAHLESVPMVCPPEVPPLAD